MLVLVFIFAGLEAFAGPVIQNARVCGATVPYSAYGEPARGLYGTSNTPLKDQFFRVRGYLNIDSSLAKPGLPKSKAIADFLSAHEIKGVTMCIKGSVETVQRDLLYSYYLTPRSFQITEKAGNMLHPSDLPGEYEKKNVGRISLRSAEDNGTRRFESPDMAEVLFEDPPLNCPDLRSRIQKGESTLPVRLNRLDKLTLAGDTLISCRSDRADEVIRVRADFLDQRPSVRL